MIDNNNQSFDCNCRSSLFRSPNSERRASVNSDASGDTAVNDDTDNCDKKPDIDPPLMLASLAGIDQSEKSIQIS